MSIEISAIDIIKVLFLGTLGFAVAFIITPFLTNFLYKHRLWKKEVRDKAVDGGDVTYFKKFHSEGEVKTPRMGGILIWKTVLIVTFVFWALAQLTDIWWIEEFNFLSRGETWLPLFALVTASILGLIDDFFVVSGRGKYIGGGLSLKKRLLIFALIGLVGALWFYLKLDWSTIYLPGIGSLEINGWYIPLFILVMLAVYSSGVVDGLDGLSGGVFTLIFTAFAGIAMFLGQTDLAAFCAVILGALLAFLWFNIPPARFYMGETGIMGLCATLTVIAFLTDSVFVLPIIGIILVAESASVIIQLLSKKFRGKKVFLASPIHHHFEALGWPHYKITMRFWVIGAVAALAGLAIRLLG